VPSCSKPSRYGLARVANVERPVRRPTNLDGSCARRPSESAVGAEESLRRGRTKERNAPHRRNYLTTKAPYKEPAGS
jgi:hypothetical protein